MRALKGKLLNEYYAVGLKVRLSANSQEFEGRNQ